MPNSLWRWYTSRWMLVILILILCAIGVWSIFQPRPPSPYDLYVRELHWEQYKLQVEERDLQQQWDRVCAESRSEWLTRYCQVLERNKTLADARRTQL